MEKVKFKQKRTTITATRKGLTVNGPISLLPLGGGPLTKALKNEVVEGEVESVDGVLEAWVEEDAFRQCVGAEEDDAGVRSLAEGGLLQEPWRRKSELESSFSDFFLEEEEAKDERVWREGGEQRYRLIIKKERDT